MEKNTCDTRKKNQKFVQQKKSHTGLEWHESEYIITEFSFFCELSL